MTPIKILCSTFSYITVNITSYVSPENHRFREHKLRQSCVAETNTCAVVIKPTLRGSTHLHSLAYNER